MWARFHATILFALIYLALLEICALVCGWFKVENYWSFSENNDLQSLRVCRKVILMCLHNYMSTTSGLRNTEANLHSMIITLRLMFLLNTEKPFKSWWPILRIWFVSSRIWLSCSFCTFYLDIPFRLLSVCLLSVDICGFIIRPLLLHCVLTGLVDFRRVKNV